MSTTTTQGALKRLLTGPAPWWAWPTTLVVIAAGALIAAWTVYPGPDEQMMIFGIPFGGECGMVTAFGFPCPQCGMTRSWVYTSRGDLLSGFTYNAAGAMLLLWLVAGGVVGAVRLALRNRTTLSPPWPLLVALATVWFVVPYILMWLLRIVFHLNALPTFIPMGS